MRAVPKNKIALPFEEWPERDRWAWAEAQIEGAGLLDESRPASRWRDSSKELYRRCYGMWLRWLREQDLLDPDAAPEDRVTRARVVAYLAAQRQTGNKARTLVNHAVSLRHMFEALAPGHDWTWMLPAIRKLKEHMASTKNHSDLPSIKELFDLGMLMMRHATREETGSPKQRSVRYRNGMVIAMLAARPFMRRNNIARIEIDKHLVREGATYRLRFSGDEMKGRRARGGNLPEVLTPLIDRYMGLYRHILLIGKPDTSGMLWISGMGLPVYPHALSDRIGKVTEAFFGRRVCLHEFRHAAGSSTAKEDPEHVGIVPSVLGQADFAISESYYIFADEYAAFKRLDQALTRLENDAAP